MGLMLKVRKAEFEGKLAEAKGILGDLTRVKATFQILLNELNTQVITGEDTNFNMAEEMVKNDLDSTDVAIRDAEQARDSLAESVKHYEEAEEAGRDALNKGINAARDAINAAKSVRSVM
jgi:hypothetical protein